jgi:hypothetical protein
MCRGTGATGGDRDSGTKWWEEKKKIVEVVSLPFLIFGRRVIELVNLYFKTC